MDEIPNPGLHSVVLMSTHTASMRYNVYRCHVDYSVQTISARAGLPVGSTCVLKSRRHRAHVDFHEMDIACLCGVNLPTFAI
jgi:hypothetical protein